MIDWWNSLEPAMKVLWAVTLSASLVFVIQTVMTFLGAAGDTDFDINTDMDTAGPSDVGDGSVDVADISAIITHMAGNATYETADVNGDGAIDVADISAVIMIMANN